MAKGLIGISTAEQGRYSAFYASLSGLQRPAGDIISVFACSAVISQNRNNITQEALNQDADWVLYLDDDHILRGNTLTRLLAADKDVISAHYCQRQQPFNPVLMDVELPDRTYLWKQLSPKEHGITEVKAVGAGCLLVKRAVLEALKPPYWTLGQINPASWGDDLDFCTRVRAAGFKIYCDLDAHIGHIMTGVVWPERDEKSGWVVKFAQNPAKGPIAQFLMPLPGDM